MTELHLNLNENREVWDTFVSTSPQRSIFVYSKFLDSFNLKYDFVTCYDKDKIVAGVPVIYNPDGSPVQTPLPYTQYQGLLFADFSQNELHSQTSREFSTSQYFIEELSKHFKELCLCNSWRLRDIRPFQWHHYHETEKGLCKLGLRYTGILPLDQYASFDEYLCKIRKVKRQEFKKSSQVLNFKKGTDVDILDNLHGKTMERQGIERQATESQLVKSIASNAINNNMGEIYYALLNGEPVSSVLFLYDDRTAYYLFGANDPDHRKSFSGTYLLLNMIKQMFDREIEEVDFLGVNSPNRGDFKLSLNAELKPYYITSFNNK